MGSGAAMYSFLNNSAWGLNTTSYVDSQYTKDTIAAVFLLFLFVLLFLVSHVVSFLSE